MLRPCTSKLKAQLNVFNLGELKEIHEDASRLNAVPTQAERRCSRFHSGENCKGRHASEATTLQFNLSRKNASVTGTVHVSKPNFGRGKKVEPSVLLQ